MRWSNFYKMHPSYSPPEEMEKEILRLRAENASLKSENVHLRHENIQISETLRAIRLALIYGRTY